MRRERTCSENTGFHPAVSNAIWFPHAQFYDLCESAHVRIPTYFARTDPELRSALRSWAATNFRCLFIQMLDEVYEPAVVAERTGGHITEIYRRTWHGAVSNSNDWIRVNNELKSGMNRNVKVLYRHLPGETDKNHKIFSQYSRYLSRDSKQVPPESTSEELPLELTCSASPS
jgi:hypothetical protein